MQTMTRTEIYDKAIERWTKAHPNRKAAAEIAQLLFVSEKQIYAILRGERYFTLEQEERFFVVCNFPEGLILKQEMLFSWTIAASTTLPPSSESMQSPMDLKEQKSGIRTTSRRKNGAPKQ